MKQRASTFNRRGTRPSLKALWIIGCLLLWSAAAMAGLVLLNSHHDLHTHPRQTYTVQPGDTLWGIAESVNKDQRRNVWSIIGDIQKWNGLQDEDVQPGEVLVIPMKGR